MSTFVDKLRDSIRRIDRDLTEKRLPKDVSVPRQRLYDIHKRSLPVGVDKKVVIGVTEKEARHLMETRLKSKVLMSGDRVTVIYWDLIPQESHPSQRSVYYNSPDVTTYRVVY